MKRNRLWSVTIAVGVATFVLTGCNLDPGKKLTKAMQSWVGHPASLLVMAWGPPQQVFADGMGGRVLVYTEQRVFGARPATSTTYSTGMASIYDNMIWGSGTSTTTYRPAMLYGYTAWRTFYIGPDGNVYGFSWKGVSSGPDIIVEGRQPEPGKSRQLELTIYKQKEEVPEDKHRSLQIDLPSAGKNLDEIEHDGEHTLKIDPTGGVELDGRKWSEETFPALAQ